MGTPTLAASFVEAAPHLAVPADEALDRALSHLLETSRAAWPTVTVEPDAFARYVAERAESGASSDVERLRGADLYVACAVVAGDAGAVAALDQRVTPTLRESLRRMRLAPERIDDILQSLRRLLFVGDEASPPRIVEYAGTGDLVGWLRVSATRSALKAIRREKREVSEHDAESRELVDRAADGDPELFYMKAVYREAFRGAFQRALDSLTDREKNLLRQHVVDELSIDDLAALYHVHRATAARWLVAAREALLERTRRAFAEDARVSKDECESVLRLVQSQLDGTIRRRLERLG